MRLVTALLSELCDWAQSAQAKIEHRLHVSTFQPCFTLCLQGAFGCQRCACGALLIMHLSWLSEVLTCLQSEGGAVRLLDI